MVNRDRVVSGSIGLAILQSRPKEWSAALNALLASPYATFIDPNRVVAVGFSAGGYTALAVGGAHPSSLALDEYCLSAPPTDVLCLEFSLWDKVASWLGMRKESLSELRDARVRAIVAMAPPGLALFPPSGMEGFDVPTLLIQGDRDEILKYPNNAGYLKSILGQRAEYRIVPGEHLVFMSINPKQLEDAKDDETESLQATHAIIENFLERVLTSPPS